MKINPIIPIWLMTIICVVLLTFRRKGIAAYIRQIVMVILLFIINLRIMVPDGTVYTSERKLDASVIIVVDDTVSMLARDYADDTARLDGVKADCRYIIDELYGAKFSVISFDNEANLLCPFTSDPGFATDVIEAIVTPDPFYAKGSSMNAANELMTECLKNAADRGEGKVLLFFISDGEITNGESLESFKDASGCVDDGAVLGYGTREGAKMYYTDTYSYYLDGEAEEEVVRNSDYEEGISKIDEDNLKQIADDLNLEYIHMQQQSDIAGTVQRIKSQIEGTEEAAAEKGYGETYHFFVIPLLFLLIYEFWKGSRRNG